MRAQGFTLIEIMVAIAIMALITALALPGFNYAFRTNTDSFARTMAAVFRESRDRALLRRQLVRVKIDLAKQQYWVEEAPSSYMLPSEAENKKAAEENWHGSNASKEEEKKEEAFSLARDISSNKRPLPYGVKIVKVLSPRYKEPVTDGEAEVYYLPSGLSDPAIIHIEDMEKSQRSLVINPITGNTKLEQGFVEGDKK